VLTHLFKYDTSHGKFPGTVEQKEQYIVVNGRKILLLNERAPEKLPWKDLQVDVVMNRPAVLHKGISRNYILPQGRRKS